MHTGPVPGTFTKREEVSQTPCPECGKKEVLVREWDSDDGAYTDYKCECKACGHSWWEEGIDS